MNERHHDLDEIDPTACDGCGVTPSTLWGPTGTDDLLCADCLGDDEAVETVHEQVSENTGENDA